MYFYIVFGTIALLFLLIKGMFLCFIPQSKLPPIFERSFRYIPPAVLAALVAPAVIYTRRAGGFDVSSVKIAAGAIAFGVALKTRSILVTIAAGMALLWLFSHLAGNS